MARAYCPECGTDVPVDDQGRCHIGHVVDLSTGATGDLSESLLEALRDVEGAPAAETPAPEPEPQAPPATPATPEPATPEPVAPEPVAPEPVAEAPAAESPPVTDRTLGEVEPLDDDEPVPWVGSVMPEAGDDEPEEAAAAGEPAASGAPPAPDRTPAPPSPAPASPPPPAATDTGAVDLGGLDDAFADFESAPPAAEPRESDQDVRREAASALGQLGSERASEAGELDDLGGLDGLDSLEGLEGLEGLDELDDLEGLEDLLDMGGEAPAAEPDPGAPRDEREGEPIPIRPDAGEDQPAPAGPLNPGNFTARGSGRGAPPDKSEDDEGLGDKLKKIFKR